ncbi:MAG TPA: YdcH family protein [Hyphomonas sp.]|nr:YdcH family protein [Hyphomonas sp.]HRK69797.1 YdcH family protein [Hyphomonas sp.]
MTHTPHELAADFPELAGKIEALKAADPHFARLAGDYHALNREIHRVETNIEPASDARQADLRRRRMTLKDELYARLRAAV